MLRSRGRTRGDATKIRCMSENGSAVEFSVSGLDLAEADVDSVTHEESLSLENLTSEREAVLRKVCDSWGLILKTGLPNADLSHSHSAGGRLNLPSSEQEVSEMLAPFIGQLGYRE